HGRAARKGSRLAGACEVRGARVGSRAGGSAAGTPALRVGRRGCARGHEPSVHELASYLLTADTGHVQIEFRKGGVAALEIDEGLRPGTARLIWLLPPRVLRALAK